MNDDRCKSTSGGARCELSMGHGASHFNGEGETVVRWPVVSSGRWYLLGADGHSLGLYRDEDEAREALGRRPDAVGGSVAQARKLRPARVSA